MKKGPIGIFDSGYGGLTVFQEIESRLPQYDFVYLGDNARVPYGTRSFETVYQYTWECVQHLFAMDCNLVVLACNTASAKALRSIQQNNLPLFDLDKRVLGVIRPTAEVVGAYTKTRKIGILATQGTVSSLSYVIEINKFFPDIQVFQEACPLWVPLVESNEFNTPGADYFIEKNLDNLFKQSPDIDTVVLACTHYPLLINSIKKFLPDGVRLVSQGKLVAESLEDYLERHTQLRDFCSLGTRRDFYTTGAADDFNEKATLFLGHGVESKHLPL
ncbi:Glutamate racemase [Arcticibacter svalbardensis MN12-7]|uniref:Glutamate racemase n=1 Tax=Arcticibacter svalbardensis MN12-7 TaxID=1150600 RepID=R9GTB9_9SPHI|nr:glutamate racemase [Arcticibacter svalbardensis]EOR94785.1 Glutamate racemase [Arcticibacter svalbardensis MN12-7]